LSLNRHELKKYPKKLDGSQMLYPITIWVCLLRVWLLSKMTSYTGSFWDLRYLNFFFDHFRFDLLSWCLDQTHRKLHAVKPLLRRACNILYWRFLKIKTISSSSFERALLQTFIYTYIGNTVLITVAKNDGKTQLFILRMRIAGQNL
jgi:hypothetical protein